jgi:DNA topoisomerase-1
VRPPMQPVLCIQAFVPTPITKPKRSRRRTAQVEIVTNPAESAKAAGLRYVSDSRPGIRRQRSGSGFRYRGVDGAPVTDMATLARIRSLVIPPAWTGVWICPIANGHLQATGRDARGRKQSRYHPHWREARDETKYERMTLFGAALPGIRKRIEHDLALAGLAREKILAAIVRLLETTFIRVGNTEYAKTNHSYGLTTLRNKHVTVKSSTVTFNFQGKSGVEHTIDLQDRRLARIVERCRDLPGYELFQYLDHDGNRHSIDAADVNDYLREISGQDFTAKDFRTWAGTVLACEMLRQFEPAESDTQAKKNIVAAIKSVAQRLGNTPSVCRKCYVHPAVLDSYLGGSMLKILEHEVEREVDKQLQALRKEELDVLHLLEQRLAKAA